MPFNDAETELRVSVVAVAPAILLKVPPPLVLSCHWTVGAGEPLAAAVKLTFEKTAAVWLVGFVVTDGAVQVGALTVRSNCGLALFFQRLLSLLLKLALTFPLAAAVGVSVTEHLALFVDPTCATVHGFPTKVPAVPVPVNWNVIVPCGNPLVTGLDILVTVAVQVVAVFTAIELGEHEIVVSVVSPAASVNVVWADDALPTAVR